jgi:hypothetical protein
MCWVIAGVSLARWSVERVQPLGWRAESSLTVMRRGLFVEHKHAQVVGLEQDFEFDEGSARAASDFGYVFG